MKYTYIIYNVLKIHLLGRTFYIDKSCNFWNLFLFFFEM